MKQRFNVGVSRNSSFTGFYCGLRFMPASSVMLASVCKDGLLLLLNPIRFNPEKISVFAIVGKRDVEQQTLSVRSPIGTAMPFLNALGYTPQSGDLEALLLSEFLEKM